MKTSARVRRTFEKGTDWRSENIKKRDAKVNKLKKALAETRSDRIVAKADAEEVSQALADKNLQERINILVQEKRPVFTFLSPEEKAIIVELFHEGINRKRIGEIIGRPLQTVSKFLQRYASTATASRMFFEANADRLARRIVKNANVEQSLEVMDRLDVLPVKERASDAGGARFNVMIGVPGAGPGIPVPSQSQIEQARTIPAKKIE